MTKIYRTWVRMLKPFGYHDMHKTGDVIHVDVKEDVDFFVASEIAEIVKVEVLHFRKDEEGWPI